MCALSVCIYLCVDVYEIFTHFSIGNDFGIDFNWSLILWVTWTFV